jgi:transposase
MEFMADFPDDATCLEWLWTTRYSPDGKHADCPKCELRHEFKRYETSQQRQSWTCTACGFHLYPTAGTIFHKSSTSLHLWFDAMYLMTSTRFGISAKQLERSLASPTSRASAFSRFILVRPIASQGYAAANGRDSPGQRAVW